MYCFLQSLFQTMSCKDVITDEICTDYKYLCQSIRRRLYCISQVYSKLISVTQQVLKMWG